MALPPGLCRVDAAVSIVCADEDGTRAWSLLREFGRWEDFHGPFEEMPVRSTLLLGEQERMAGARRVLSLGHGKLVEQLVAFDEDRQRLAWKLITHPANVNPFASAFVNYACAVRVRRSTLTQQSLVEVTASFMTDAPAAAAMQARLACLHEACLRGLAQALAPLPPPPPPQQQPQLCAPLALLQQPQQTQQQLLASKPVGSWDAFACGPASPRGCLSLSRQGAAALQEFLGPGRQDSGESARSARMTEQHFGGFVSGGSFLGGQ